VQIVSDRTQTIVASVADVRFPLLLTIVLAVGVIAVFLRRLWATVIPGIAVPISIVGTFAAMYALGFSLDNLSLMGLSIAVGFVVDADAKVLATSPRDRTRLSVGRRIDSSSSMIAIIGSSDTLIFPFAGWRSRSALEGCPRYALRQPRFISYGGLQPLCGPYWAARAARPP
jgi:multidrug efflux pump subunit AcrB